MGGEDWRDWIEALSAADVLEKDAVTVAYSYIGPEITHPIYADGSIGRAKEHLYRTAAGDERGAFGRPRICFSQQSAGYTVERGYSGCAAVYFDPL